MEEAKTEARGLLFRGAKGEIFFVHDFLLPLCEVKDEKTRDSLSKLLNNENIIDSKLDNVIHVKLNQELEKPILEKQESLLKKLSGGLNIKDLYFPW